MKLRLPDGVGGTYDVHHERVGRGPAVYFIHGGPGLDHTYFRPFVDELALDYEIVFYDQRGCGRSDRFDRAKPIDWGVASWASEIGEVARSLGHERFVLIAHSFGALAAGLFAARSPDRVRGLVLCCPPSIFDFNPTKTDAEIANDHAFRDVDDETFRARWIVASRAYFRRYDLDLAADLDLRARYSALANAYGFASIERLDTRFAKGRVYAPSLVIAGRHDNAIKLSQTTALIADLPHSQLVMFENSGHFPFIEERDAFLDETRRFLQSLPA